MKPNESIPPSVDDVRFADLYEREEYPVETSDGWRLIVTRYKPVVQSFEQPLFGQPIVLVHGFTQNRHAWSAGEFVKNLLYFGIDVHILELRGHGKSSVYLQQRLHRDEGRPLPADIGYGWDIDSYFLHDVPAAVRGVKEKTGRDKIFYCGHSMGGMLGYGYAGLNDDLLGMVTVGAPSQLGRGFWPIRMVAMLDMMTPMVLSTAGVAERVWRTAQRLPRAGKGPDTPTPESGTSGWDTRALPFDYLLRTWGALISRSPNTGVGWLDQRIRFLYNPRRVVPENILWLLTWGGEKEPLGVARQFARWIRRGELKCYRTNQDFAANYPRIQIPMAIIFGDEDRLANLASTRSIYRSVGSEYLLWRPVRGNSHMELTMGHDIRQICYDIKNLMEYAITHVKREPSLPKRAEGPVRTDAGTRRARRLRIVK